MKATLLQYTNILNSFPTAHSVQKYLLTFSSDAFAFFPHKICECHFKGPFHDPNMLLLLHTSVDRQNKFISRFPIDSDV